MSRGALTIDSMRREYGQGIADRDRIARGMHARRGAARAPGNVGIQLDIISRRRGRCGRAAASGKNYKHL